MTSHSLIIEQIPVESRTLEPARHTNVYLLACSGQGVLIDAGFSDDRGLAAIEDAWRRHGEPAISAIVVTHRHRDHISGLDTLVERFQAPVAAHPSAHAAIRDVVPALQPQALHDGQTIPFADRALAVVATPGHASDHLSFWLPDRRIVFCGDVISGHGTVAIIPPDGNLRAYLDSVRRIMALEPARLAPGHGPWIDTPQQTLQELIDHRLDRERQIIDLLNQEPQTARSLARRIYAGDIPDSLLPVAARTVAAHLIKLWEDGRVAAANGSVNPADLESLLQTIFHLR